MTDRTPDPTAESRPEGDDYEGTVHSGPGPRLRRTGRTAAILGVLAFIGLLTFLTARYSHDFGPVTEEEQAARSPLSSIPLSAERIEEFARRRLEEELQAAQQPPPPPDLEFEVPSEPPSPKTAGHRPSSLSSGPPSAPPRAERPALHSPLTPRGVRTTTAPDANAIRVPELPPFPELPPELASPPTESARVRPPGGFSGAFAPEAPSPIDRRSIELPPAAAYALARIPAPNDPTLYAGTAVPLVLTHALATEVAGPVRAYVTRDILDSVTGRRIVIPRGSLALGHQAAHAASGDRRILIHWQRLVLPSGDSYALPVLPAGSLDGTAGVRGDVDNHWWSRVGSAVALSLVGAGVQLSQPQERTSVQGFAPSEGQILAQHFGLDLGRLSEEILRRGVNRPPTIRLRAGQRLTLLLTRDLQFPR